MSTCASCGRTDPLISESMGACAACLRSGASDALEAASALRAGRRARFDLPAEVPRSPGGIVCEACMNACRLAEGETGWCGARAARDGRVEPLAGEGAAHVDWYLDPLPTNCVAAGSCAAASEGRGRSNLAVFYNGCGFDCAFCQNWHHRHMAAGPRTSDELARAARDPGVACICHFGGDPAPHHEHALAASERAVCHGRNDVPRVCWETNGSMSRSVLERVIDSSERTGGTVKFDLKAWSEPLHEALTGVSNRQTLSNFRILATRARHGPSPPLAAASTLLVPGYVDAGEVSAIARFIAELDPALPYSLLAFHPDFAMHDLPLTSRAQAQECLDASRAAGLERVRIGNIHLL